MGFFSSLVKTPKVKTPATGFYSQPKEYQNLYNSVLGGANATNSQINADMFTPLAQTADETQAFNMARQGIGTEQNFNKNISMLMNPYDEYVINDINRQATGQNSLVNQAATQAGQQGSNRSFLGTSDVEQNRLNAIGQFRQGQYNNAVNQALGPLAGLQQQDINNLLGIGDFQRGLDYQTNIAPVAAQQARSGLLSAIPTQFGDMGYKASSSGGNFDAGKALQTAGTVAGFFSDKRLKENIEKVGEENGFSVYEFNYIGDSSRFRGVMAQEVKEIMPEAVFESEGFMRVNYDMIGIEMQVVNG